MLRGVVVAGGGGDNGGDGSVHTFVCVFVCARVGAAGVVARVLIGGGGDEGGGRSARKGAMGGRRKV